MSSPCGSNRSTRRSASARPALAAPPTGCRRRTGNHRWRPNLSGLEWLTLSLAVALLLAAGIWHLLGLLVIKRVSQALDWGGPFTVLLAFWGLALLHLSEIVIGAFVYGAAIHWLGLGSVEQGYGDSAGGLLYLSGISFATLGYTQQIVHGPLRLMTMLNALGGFMLITWSATYVYSIWGEYFRERDDD